jgi:2-hydroxy-6-oxonona-2,4-dienedioate hydrolase
MSDSLQVAGPSPAETLAALERLGRRCLTRHRDRNFAWHIWGEGYPLVLMHGGGGTWMHWVRNIEALAADCQLLVPDLPGFGESDDLEHPVDADAMAAAVASGINDLIGPDRQFAVAGFSLGGVISGHVAHQLGGRVERIALVGCAGLGLPRGPMERLQSWRRLPTAEAQRAAHRRNLAILMIHDPDKIDELAVHIQTYGATRARQRGKSVSPTSRLLEYLPHVKGRIAALWGSNDPTAAPHIAEREALLRTFQPDLRFDVVPDAGHWVQYEAAPAVNAFLRQTAVPGR